jgi:hypothetical protein
MPSYYDQINNLSPKVWYRFNETSGTPANSGSLSTTSSFIDITLNQSSSVDGVAVSLNGSSSYIQLPSHSEFALFNDRSFTVEAWVKIANADTNRSAPLEIFRLNAPSSPHYVVSLTVDGTAGTRGKARLASTWTTDILSTNAIDDGAWHHVVYTYNTGSVKLYIDGTLNSSTTPSSLPASFNFDQSSKKLIGAGYTGISQASIGQYLKGGVDEFAAYDYELTSTNILGNFNAGASVEYADTPQTATALFVHPSLTTQAILAADPATASATFPEAQQSDLDLPLLLNQYMQSLNTSGYLEQWYKFDEFKNIVNSGNGGSSVFTFAGNAESLIQSGVQFSGAIGVTGSLNDGSVFANLSGVLAANPELSDSSYVAGCWIKTPSSITSGRRDLWSVYDGSKGASVYTGGGTNSNSITFTVTTSSGEHPLSGTTNVMDGNWHFVACKQDGSAMQLFIDGVSQGTLTTNGSLMGTATELAFGRNNVTAFGGDKILISSFFIGNITNITTGVITNIYNAGKDQMQGTAVMQQPVFKSNSAFNNYIESKYPLIDYRFNESTGTPSNFGSLSLTPSLGGTSYVLGETALDGKAIKFTNRDTTFKADYSLASGTVSTDDKVTMGVLFKSNNISVLHPLIAFGGFLVGNFPSAGCGNTLLMNSNGTLSVRSGNADNTFDNNTGTTNYGDSNWHLAIVVQDTSTLNLYVDGKLEFTANNGGTPFTDSGQFAVAGFPGLASGANSSLVKFIDNAFIVNGAFTANEVFDAWQSLRLEMDTTATAAFPMPAVQAGTGRTIIADVMTASAFLPNVFPFISPATASGLFQMPNFLAVRNVSNAANVMTAAAQGENPGFNIGENNLVLHMNAAASFPEARALIPGFWNANPGIALNATLVMPALSTTLGALIKPETLTARAFLPLPPAYITLADDPWFVRLLQGHSDKKSEFIQGIRTNLPNQSSTDIIGGGFLSFFDDVLNPITQSTNPNTISSEIPAYYFKPIEDLQFDTNGNLIALDTSKNVARVTPSRGVLTPTPIVAPGYFDNQQRKAVRISNIEIPLPGTSTNFSIRPYNIEFSFKATKQNQVLAYGQFTSPSSTNSRKVGAIGLFNGKIYLAEDFYTPVSAFGEVGLRSLRVAGSVPHPVNFTEETYVGYMLGNKNVADGQWHHIVIQRGYTDNRTQIWIDGALDKQLGVQSNDGRSTGYANIPGSDASQEVRPYIIGFNSADTNLSSDFETSGWNYYPGRFLEEREVSLNNLAFIQANPIKAEPMTATAAATPNNKAAGNKARALLLYWWPVTRDGGSESTVSNDNGQFGLSDTPTFDKSIYTYDYEDEIPQDYYGWDIFPVSVTGYAGSLGGERSPFIKESVLQSGGYYINPVTSAPRYLDVLNDIDLSAFDAIFFRNYPDQAEERDSYIREEFSDEYFNLKEKELYNDFIASLRAASDTGISLFITNTQLAIDLGIIEGYEEVPDLSSGQGDEYAPTIVPGGGLLDEAQGLFIDVHRNNRLRVVNTIDGLTNEPGYIWQDWAYFRGGAGENADAFTGSPNRPFISLANKPNGLQVGDTFVISDVSHLDTYYEAVPFNKVKAGKIVTAFANTYVNGTTVTDNPYKNYATTIALEPGTILNGTPTVGKIFVNFTERLDRTTGAVSFVSGRGMRITDGARDNLTVDLIQDEWINASYDNGEISLAIRDAYLAASFNLDRRLEAEIAGQNRPNVIADIQREKYWDSNGLYILTQKSSIEDPTGAIYKEDPNVPGFGKGTRSTRINKVRKDGTPTTGSVTSSLQWFSFTYSYQYLRAAIQVPSMLTRGFRWLSNKIVDEGRVIRTEAASAIASMPNHLGVGNKPVTVNAQAMLSLATIVDSPTYSSNSVLVNTLPLTATAVFGEFAKNIRPDVLTGSASFRDPRILSIEEDEVVLYIYHVDPILYLREDVIK